LLAGLMVRMKASYKGKHFRVPGVVM